MRKMQKFHITNSHFKFALLLDFSFLSLRLSVDEKPPCLKVWLGSKEFPTDVRREIFVPFSAACIISFWTKHQL